MKYLKELFGGKLHQFTMIGALVLIILVFQYITGGKVLEAENLMNVIRGNTYVLVLAMGMVLVIIAGHIDLSVGSIAATVGIIVATVCTHLEMPAVVGLLTGLLVGLAIGCWHGFWVALWGIPAFIVTLAGMMIFRGMNQWIGASLTVPVPDLFKTLGAGYMPDIAPEIFNFNLPTMIFAAILAVAFTWMQLRNFRRDKADGLNPTFVVMIIKVVVIDALILGIMWVFATGRPGTSFPIPGVIVVLLALFYSFLASNTVLGRSIYAVGGNKHAAELTGVRVRWANFFVMCNMAVLAAVAGMLFIGRATASGPQDGNMWELDAIAAVFIGGAAVSGGIGTVGATMIGALVMAFLNNGLQLWGAGSHTTQMIKGLVLLAAVAVDVYSKRSGRRSLIGTFMNARKTQAKFAEGEKAAKQARKVESKEAKEIASEEAAQAAAQVEGGNPSQKSLGSGNNSSES